VNDVTQPRFAYLLLSHDRPRVVESVVARILELSPQGQVVLHHDFDAPEVPWQGSPPDRVHLVERSRVQWGGWSIVEATLRTARFALEVLQSDWLVSLSGEHWPVVDLARWESELDASGVDALLPGEALPRRLRFGTSDADGNRFLARCVHRWSSVARPRSALAHRAMAGLAKTSLLTHPLGKLEFSLRNDAWFVGLPRARGPVRDWTLFKGSQWFAIDARAAETVLHTDPDVTAWFARSHIADESYVHTVLHQRGDLVVEDRLVTFVRPEPTTPTKGWMMLRPADLPAVWASGAAFARKVDPFGRPEVIEALDDHVERQRTGACAS
jgi:hypothetical protein